MARLNFCAGLGELLEIVFVLHGLIFARRHLVRPKSGYSEGSTNIKHSASISCVVLMVFLFVVCCFSRNFPADLPLGSAATSDRSPLDRLYRDTSA